jgi:hypothetical protein
MTPMLQKKLQASKELDFSLNSFPLPDGMIAETRTSTYTYNPYTSNDIPRFFSVTVATINTCVTRERPYSTTVHL